MTRLLLLAPIAALVLTACGGGGGSSDSADAGPTGFCIGASDGQFMTLPADADGTCTTARASARLDELAPLEDGTTLSESTSDRDCSAARTQAVRAYGESETRERFDLRPIQGPIADLVTYQAGQIRLLFEIADQGCRVTSYPPI